VEKFFSGSSFKNPKCKKQKKINVEAWLFIRKSLTLFAATQQLGVFHHCHVLCRGWLYAATKE